MKIAVLNSIGVQNDKMSKINHYYLVADSYDFNGNSATNVTSISNLKLFYYYLRLDYYNFRDSINIHWINSMSLNWSALTNEEKKIIATLFLVDSDLRSQVLSDEDIELGSNDLVYHNLLKAVKSTASSIKSSSAAYIQNSIINDNPNIFEKKSIGSMYIVDNTIATPVFSTGVYVKPSGSAAQGVINDSFSTLNGEIRYIGKNLFSGTAFCDGDITTSQTQRHVSITILKNGSVIENAKRDIDIDKNQTTSFSINKNITLVSGDRVSLGIKNKETTESLVVTNYNLTIR